MKRKILNLLDWSSHINCIVGLFDDYGVDADYVRLIEPWNKAEQALVHPRVTNVIIGSQAYYDYLNSDRYDILWLHSFEWAKAEFVVKFKNRCKVLWSVFGGGYDYAILLPNLEFYGPETHRCMAFKTGWLRGKYKRLRAWVAFHYRWHKYHVSAFLKKVDGFSLVMPTEEPILRQLLPKAKCFEFLYTDARKLMPLSSLPELKWSDTCVWVGNSSSLMNNHLDAIATLKPYVNLIDELVMPLSYAANVTITPSEIRHAAESTGFKVKVYSDFVGYDEFKKRMSECCSIVFPQLQQGGCGNVSLAFALGLKVFFSKKSPVYQFYRQLGCKVFTLEDDLKGENPFTPLSMADRIWNYNCSNSRQVWRVFPEKTKPYIAELRKELEVT